MKFSDAQSKCAALALCRRCIKYTDVPCGLKRTFLFMILALMVLCGVPFSADFTTAAYNTKVLGTFYNFGHAVVHQIYEIRYCPAVAMGLLGASLAVLTLKKNDPVLWSKLFSAAGAAPWASATSGWCSCRSIATISPGSRFGKKSPS